MKLDDMKREVKTSGLGEGNSFTIQNSRHMFNMLSSKLYSDKVLAVMRELTCNAADAHTMAGNVDTPYDVHLPTSLEPEFHVKDYGVGLSHEDVLHLYTTYGASNKRHSNDCIGGMGVGSKAPFAYTDQFTVESRFNGKIKTYSCYVDDFGNPQIVNLNNSTTEEPNGLTVRVPIKNSDIREFHDKASTLFKHYKSKFKLNKEVDLSLNKSLEGDGWFYEDHIYKTDNYLIMGDVRYKLDKYKFDDDIKCYMKSLYIDLPIGTCNITASREELEYTKETIKVIENKIKEIATQMSKQFHDQANDCTTGWDVYCSLHEYNNISPVQIPSVKWKGLTINHKYSIQVPLITKGKDYEGFMFEGKHSRFVRFSTSVRPSKNTLFIHKDNNNQWKIRVKEYLKDKEYTNVFIFGGGDIKDIWDKLYNPTYIKVSDLPQIKRTNTSSTKGSSTPAVEASLKKLEHGDKYFNLLPYENTKYDMSLGGVFVKSIKGELKDKYLPDVKVKLQTLSEMCGINITLWVIPGNYHRRLEKNIDKWVEFDYFYSKSIDDYLKTNKINKTELKKYLTLKLTFNSYYGKRVSKLLDFKANFKSTDLREINKHYLKYKTLENKYISIKHNIFGEVEIEQNTEVLNLITKVEDKYPLLMKIYYPDDKYKDEVITILEHME